MISFALRFVLFVTVSNSFPFISNIASLYRKSTGFLFQKYHTAPSILYRIRILHETSQNQQSETNHSGVLSILHPIEYEVDGSNDQPSFGQPDDNKLIFATESPVEKTGEIKMTMDERINFNSDKYAELEKELLTYKKRCNILEVIVKSQKEELKSQTNFELKTIENEKTIAKLKKDLFSATEDQERLQMQLKEAALRLRNSLERADRTSSVFQDRVIVLEAELNEVTEKYAAAARLASENTPKKIESARINALTEELNSARELVRRLQEKLESSEEESSKLRRKNEELRQQAGSLQAENTQARKELEVLFEGERVMKAMVDRSKATVRAVEQQSKALESEAALLRSQLEEAQSALASSEERSRRYEADISMYRRRNSILETVVKKYKFASRRTPLNPTEAVTGSDQASWRSRFTHSVTQSLEDSDETDETDDEEVVEEGEDEDDDAEESESDTDKEEREHRDQLLSNYKYELNDDNVVKEGEAAEEGNDDVGEDFFHESEKRSSSEWTDQGGRRDEKEDFLMASRQILEQSRLVLERSDAILTALVTSKNPTVPIDNDNNEAAPKRSVSWKLEESANLITKPSQMVVQYLVRLRRLLSKILDDTSPDYFDSNVLERVTSTLLEER